MLNAIIIDDEASGVESLQILLGKYCPSVNVAGVATSGDEAQKKIQELKPDLIFLDIEMPYGSGFDLLKKISKITFDIIFTTAYDRYAIKAIKHNAIDYLLKPIDPDELIQAVKKSEERKEKGTIEFSSADLIEALGKSKRTQKLSIKTMDGIVFVNPADIIRLKADSNYTEIFLVNSKKIMASKTLKEFEKALAGMNFFRIHNSHLINLEHVEKYVRGEGGCVTMTDASSLEVSRNKKNELLSLLSLR
jgi:two-component system LytT family response regulator